MFNKIDIANMVFEGVSRSISIAPKFCSKIKHKSSPCIICYSLCPAEAVTIGGPGETIKVDWDKCTGCGICVSQCPAQVFRLRHGGDRKFIDNLSRSITSRGDLVITCSDNPAYSRQTAVVDCAGIFNVVDFIVLYLHGASRITIKYGLCMECPSKNGRQILEQEMNLQQQTRYIESLEGMQKEMRRFRHDFKNMMSGMYLQAKDGDLEAVQSFIQDMTADFDSQVGSQIRQLTQLGNIHMAEVKGLLLGKLDEMKKGQIGCEIEVLRPFYGTKMRVTDLCRCLGILIDNAMDEVRGQEKPMVSVLISVQDGCTTFRVKNRLYHAVDFHKIWTQGYSTHGQDRGIGLASYKKLLEGYDNALPFTSVENGYFIQELKVKE